MSNVEVYDIDDIDTEQCQMCSTSLAFLNHDQKQKHYDMHFTNADTLSTGSKPPSKGKQKALNNAKDAGLFKVIGQKLSPTAMKTHDEPFWYAALSTEPPSNYAPDLIPALRKALQSSHSRDKTRKAYLCQKDTVHISVKDDKTWGCGYRNYQMACTALMNQQTQPMYFALLNAPLPPTVGGLQQTMERAWRHGFDKEGAGQLKSLVNSRKWIGITDLWVVYSFLGIPAEIVQFDCGKHPKGHRLLTDWVANYFAPKSQKPSNLDAVSALMGASAVVSTDLMPLILQHQGHSRTVVGYEVGSDGEPSLLVFDPARSAIPGKFKARRLLKEDSDGVIDLSSDDDKHNTSKKHGQGFSDGQSKEGLKLRELLEDFCRVNMKNLKRQKLYQILYFPLTAPLTERERHDRKVVTGEQAK